MLQAFYTLNEKTLFEKYIFPFILYLVEKHAFLKAV
jgi:hypothetical protein